MLFAFITMRAQALITMARYEEALEWASKAARLPNAHSHVLGAVASSLGHLGRIDEARRALGEILRLRPDYSRRLVEASFPYRHREDLERYLEGLRKAGLPD